MSDYVSRFPIDVEARAPKRNLVTNDSKHDHWLWSFRDTYDAILGQREQFQRDKAEIDQRLADGDLGAKGHATALKVLRDEHHKMLDRPRKAVAKGHEYGASLTHGSAASDPNLDKPLTVAILRAEDRRKREMARFEAKDSSAQRAAIRDASDRRDYGFLEMLLDERLVDERTARTIEVDVARGRNPHAFELLQDLHGRIEPGMTEPDPLTGCLPVMDSVIAETEKWLDEQAGIESTMAERLAEKDGGTEGA